MTSEERVIARVREHLARLRPVHTPAVYVATERARRPLVRTWLGEIGPPAEFRAEDGATIVYVDLMPEANFEHPVQYLFIDEPSGAVHVVDATTPPVDLAQRFRKVVIPE